LLTREPLKNPKKKNETGRIEKCRKKYKREKK